MGQWVMSHVGYGSTCVISDDPFPSLIASPLFSGSLVQFSSVQFSKAICIAQLSRMSHCAPAARKPVRFKFTPEARVGD